MHNAFNELSFVITVGVLVSLVARIIKQPLIIGYILTGIIVGPAVLNIIKNPETFQLFSDFGIALLLLIVGLGLNPKIIKDVGKVALAIGLVKALVATAVGYGVAQIMGYSTTASIYIGIALSFSSTIIILKLLSDRKEQNRLYGKISIGFLLVEDLMATLILIGVSGAGDDGFTLNQFWVLLYKIILLIIVLILVRVFILTRLNHIISDNQEFLFLFAIGWGLGIATLFKIAGFSLEIGALIAGVTLSPMAYAQEAASRLKPLRDFFLALFFIFLGSHLEFSSVTLVLPYAIVLSIIVLMINPITVLIVMGLFGYTKKTSFKTAMTGSQVSEFSLILILLASSKGQISSEVVTLITVVSLITIAISTYTILYSDRLYILLQEFLHYFERNNVRPEHEKRQRYELVLFGYQKGGHEFLRVFKQLNKSYVVVDYDPNVIDALEQQSVNYLYGDVGDLELLEELNIEHSRLLISAISDFQMNQSILTWLQKSNPHLVFICSADNAEQAAQLYSNGASYVMLPHYIGSEKISAFIKKSGLKKSEFKKFREKHLAYLESHSELFGTTE